MKKVSPKKACAAMALTLTMTFSSLIGTPLTANAYGLEDQSTYDSAVKGTDQTYYRTIATNYHAGSITGMVSLTSAADMDVAAGITNDMKKQGYEPVFYIADLNWNSADRKTADKAAQEMNGTLVAMLDVQLFRYEVSAYAPIHDAGCTVTMIAGIPEKSHKDGNEYTVVTQDGTREFAMVRVHNGQVTVLKDQDSDPYTLTFSTDKFSSFGLMYAPPGEIDKYIKEHNPSSGSTGSADAKNTASSKDTSSSASQTNTSGQPSASKTQNVQNDELDDVPKTGDSFWEGFYGTAHEKYFSPLRQDMLN